MANHTPYVFLAACLAFTCLTARAQVWEQTATITEKGKTTSVSARLMATKVRLPTSIKKDVYLVVGCAGKKMQIQIQWPKTVTRLRDVPVEISFGRDSEETLKLRARSGKVLLIPRPQDMLASLLDKDGVQFRVKKKKAENSPTAVFRLKALPAMLSYLGGSGLCGKQIPQRFIPVVQQPFSTARKPQAAVVQSPAPRIVISQPPTASSSEISRPQPAATGIPADSTQQPPQIRIRQRPQTATQQPSEVSSREIPQTDPPQIRIRQRPQAATQQPSEASTREIPQADPQQPPQIRIRQIPQAGTQQPSEASSREIPQTTAQQPLQIGIRQIQQTGTQPSPRGGGLRSWPPVNGPLAIPPTAAGYLSAKAAKNLDKANKRSTALEKKLWKTLQKRIDKGQISAFEQTVMQMIPDPAQLFAQVKTLARQGDVEAKLFLADALYTGRWSGRTDLEDAGERYCEMSDQKGAIKALDKNVYALVQERIQVLRLLAEANSRAPGPGARKAARRSNELRTCALLFRR